MDQLRVPATTAASVAGPRRGAALIALALAAASACGGSPTPPTPPVEALRISCPADLGIRGNADQPVTFPSPTTTGGAAPVSVSCTPASGTVFGAGATPVSCRAVDASSQVATCAFTVSVTPPVPVLSVSRYLAYGDSVTEGQNGMLAFGFDVIDTPNAYPTKLQALFDANYPGHGNVVVNRGFSGERVEDANARLPGVLSEEKPGALLLIDGYNNLLADCAHDVGVNPACEVTIEFVVGTLREAVRIARQPANQVGYVFVGTLTPPGPVTGPRDRRIAAAAIARVNSGIIRMIPGEGAIVVDLHPLFLGRESEYVASDGLHLLPPGNEVIAKAFFDAIEKHVPRSPATFGGYSGGR